MPASHSVEQPLCYGIPYVKLLNIQILACTDNGCGRIALARKPGGLLVEGSFMSGCDDTAPGTGTSRLWQTLRTYAYARLAVGLSPLSGMSDTCLNLGNLCRPLPEAGGLTPVVEEGGPTGAACRCRTTPGLVARVMFVSSRWDHRRRAPGTSHVLVPSGQHMAAGQIAEWWPSRQRGAGPAQWPRACRQWYGPCAAENHPH